MFFNIFRTLKLSFSPNWIEKDWVYTYRVVKEYNKAYKVRYGQTSISMNAHTGEQQHVFLPHLTSEKVIKGTKRSQKIKEGKPIYPPSRSLHSFRRHSQYV